jgi:protein-disulfide isomerase
MITKNVQILFGLAALLGAGAGFLWSTDNQLGTMLCGIGAVWVACTGAGLWKRWLGLLAASSSALLVSLYLGIQHKGVAGKSICSVDETFDCDKVNSSAYAELFDIPIAFLGSSFYAGVIALAILSLRSGAAYKLAPHIVALGAWGSVLYSAFLAYASFGLGAWCLFCISLYGLNALVLYLALGLVKQSDTGVVKGALAGGRSTNAFVGAAALMLVGTMAWYNAGANELPQGDTVEDLSSMFSAVEGSLTVDGTEPSYGSDAAKYTVVEFADFECPYCGRLFPEIHHLPDEDSDIQILFKHYPLSGLCNEGLGTDRHVNACAAARAADCANRQGKFWDLSRLMFKNQKHLDAEGVEIMAKQVGLDVAALTACAADPLTDAKVRNDVAHGAAAGVHATPSLFLKGLYGDDWVLVTGGPKAVAKLVKAHKAGKSFPAEPPAPKPHSH